MIRPRLWVSPIPYGLGRTKPNDYLEIARTFWENHHDLPYAWRILSRGVCDGCALGVAGFHDWTMDGIHLCTTRLDLLKLNTARALDPTVLADVATLPASAAALRALGRLPYPMLRRRGERGFGRVSWDEALDFAAARVRESPPARIAFYLTACGITNEVYYAAQKVARFIGTNNIDNAARVCHAPSTGALRQAIGVAATTCSYRDVLESDLVVLFGADVANAQPVFMKYLYLARKRGTKVIVVNPFREPGLEHYWVPSSLESAVFGTKIADRFFAIHTGADLAFVRGALKALLEERGEDVAFVRNHTTGGDALRAALAARSLDELATLAGSSVADLRGFARFYRDARSAVPVWSMGVTQHVCGTENVPGIIDLALARGNVGRPGAGLMPIRGHSGVQGGAEMGAYATAPPGGLPVNAETASALGPRYGFAVPSERGLTAAEMVEAAGRRRDRRSLVERRKFPGYPAGPRCGRARAGARRAARPRGHRPVAADARRRRRRPAPSGDDAVRAARRRDRDHHRTSRRAEPRDPGPARWRGARRVGDIRGARATGLPRASSSSRARIGGADPRGDRIDRRGLCRHRRLERGGDQFQWGGPRLCDGWRFDTPDGRAHFSTAMPAAAAAVAPGRFRFSTRRGKQFNSMIWQRRDPLTGCDRDALFILAGDAQGLGLREGDSVVVRSEQGVEVRARAHLARIRAGNVQMFWPEANALIAGGRRDSVSGVPDYNATVELARP